MGDSTIDREYKVDQHCFTCEEKDCKFPSCPYSGRDYDRYIKGLETIKSKYKRKKESEEE